MSLEELILNTTNAKIKQIGLLKIIHKKLIKENKVFCLLLLLLERKRQLTCGEIPPAMSGTCGCIVNGHLFIFGGCSDDGQTNEVNPYSQSSVFYLYKPNT